MTNSFESIVIGSGFGGTILALSIANKFQDDNAKNNTNKKVCILERGQWWLTHELNFTPQEIRKTFPNMREYLEDNSRPYHFWAHPDNVKGLITLLSADRTLSKTGLYDYKVLGNVHVLVASAVGGGSMIYSNVTLEPNLSVYKDWPTQSAGKKLEDYFDIARQFLGVNRIPTTAGLGGNLLDKSKALKDAGQALLDDGNVDIVNTKLEAGKKVLDFAVDLSITDLPPGLFDGPNPPSQDDLKRLLKQNNVCQRQGRCNIGCIPGSRHTFNKKLVDAIFPKPPAMPKPLEIMELCEAYDITFKEGAEFPYTVRYFQYEPKTEQRQPKEMLAKQLVIAAGTIGSTELLLKCKARGSLRPSEMLGKKFYTNGDLLGYTELQKRSIDSTRGPINASHVAFKTKDREFAFTIEDTTISRMVAPVFATVFDLHAHGAKDMKLGLLKDLVQDFNLLLRFGILGSLTNEISITTLVSMFSTMWINPEVRKMLVEILKTGTSSDEATRRFVESLITWATKDWSDPYAAPEERMAKFYVFSCMGTGEVPGTIRLLPNWKDLEARNDPAEKISIDWSAESNNQLFKDTVEGMKKLAGKIDAGSEKNVFTPLWNFEKPDKSTTVVLHPLGGCIMGNNKDEGVVNSYGGVFWDDGSADKTKTYPNLFVIDGSMVPNSLGVNSSLTIAALAFRVAENLVGAAFIPKA